MSVTSLTIVSPADDLNFSDLRPHVNMSWVGTGTPFTVLYEWDDNTSFTTPITDSNSGVMVNIDEGVPPSDMGGFGTDWYFRVSVTDTDTDEVQEVANDATGGTFTLTFDGQTTGNIAYNANAAAIKAALELLSNITTVGVTGTGIYSDYWIITFTNPGAQDVALLTKNDALLTGWTFGTRINLVTQGVTGATVTVPSGSYRTLSFVDPIDHPRYLYLYHNVYPGWVTSVDGAPEDFNRYLYLYHNVTTDQPCPWIASITPTYQVTGSSITIAGDSFGATPATWGGEVRLYDSVGFGGSYVTMSTTSWSDTSIDATVPTGASSGWVTVVHTTGTPTCSGSNQKLLTIEQTAADPESGWWVKVYDYKNQVAQTAQPNVVSAQISPVLNDIGTGRIDIPLSDQGLDELIDPENHIGRFTRVYTDDRYRYGFYMENLRHDVTDDGGSIASLDGGGMERIAEWAVVYPRDYPSNPTEQPVWVWGSTDNLISNPGFDDETELLKNGGGEDGNTDDGKAEGWSTRGDDVDDFYAVNDPEAPIGDWYIYVDATDKLSGITQSVSVAPNKEYYVRCWVKDPLASGMRVTLALGGADDIAKTTTYTNNFKADNEIHAELANATEGNGSSDGTWQVMDVEIKTGNEQTSLTITVQNHDSSTYNPFWMDGMFIEGWGLGLDPWVAYDGDSHASNSFRITDDVSYDGSFNACTINPLEAYAGIQQIVTTTPNTKYTLTCYGYTSSVIGGDTWDIVARKNDGLDTLLAKGSFVPVADEWTQFQVTFDTEDLQFFEPTQETIIRFAYTGSNNPGPLHVDSFSLVPGEPATTPGNILADILAPIQARGTIDFLSLSSFDETYDSAGEPWYSQVAMDINPGETLKHILDRFVAMSYEWEIVPEGFAEGGDTGAQLNVYNNRSFGSGVGRDRTDSETPSLVLETGRNSVSGGRVNKRVFSENKVFAIDQDGNWSVSEPSGYDEDETAYGRIEGYLQATVGSIETLSDFARSRLQDAADSEFAIMFDFARDSQLRPFLHFGLGDSVFVDPTPYGERNTKRVRSIVADLAGEGNDISFDVNLSKVIFEDQAAVYAAIAQLKERAPTENTGAGAGRTGSSASGFVSTTIVSETAAPHSHDLDGPEIKNTALTGDVSGSLPGPVTVNRVKGKAVSAIIPADTGGEVYWQYDRANKTWTPTEVWVESSPLTTKGDIHGFSTVDAKLGVGTDTHVLTADSGETLGIKWAAGGGSGSTVPVWMEHLADRTADGETVHADDEEFTGTIGGTAVTPTGTAVWTQSRSLLSVVYDNQTGSDIAGRAYSLTPTSSPVTIETCLGVAGPDQTMVSGGVFLSDGTATTSNVSSSMAWWTGSQDASIGARQGTFTAMGTAESGGVALGLLHMALSRIYLRIIWSASNTFKGQFSHDGVTWVDISTSSWSDTLTPTHFGAFVTIWGGSDPAYTTFEYLRVTESDLSA